MKRDPAVPRQAGRFAHRNEAGPPAPCSSRYPATRRRVQTGPVIPATAHPRALQRIKPVSIRRRPRDLCPGSGEIRLAARARQLIERSDTLEWPECGSVDR